jgi:hypothetical protein
VGPFPVLCNTSSVHTALYCSKLDFVLSDLIFFEIFAGVHPGIDFDFVLSNLIFLEISAGAHPGIDFEPPD